MVFSDSDNSKVEADDDTQWNENGHKKIDDCTRVAPKNRSNKCLTSNQPN